MMTRTYYLIKLLAFFGAQSFCTRLHGQSQDYDILCPATMITTL